MITGRLQPDEPDALRRRAAAHDVLALLDAQLAARQFLVGNSYGVADIGLYGYVHVAGEAGLELEPYTAVRGWLTRVEAQPGFVNDLDPYPANATAGAGRSIYD